MMIFVVQNDPGKGSLYIKGVMHERCFTPKANETYMYIMLKFRLNAGVLYVYK